MKEIPESEKYPVSENEMGKRYKNWTKLLARQVLLLYRLGKEVGGEKFIERLKEESYKTGQDAAKRAMKSSDADFKDCSGSLPKFFDSIDDSLGNFWDGYVENTTNAFEKEVKTCPVAKTWLEEPELCETIFAEQLRGLINQINPKFKTDGFSKLMPKGDNVCRYRVEMKD